MQVRLDLAGEGHYIVPTGAARGDQRVEPAIQPQLPVYVHHVGHGQRGPGRRLSLAVGHSMARLERQFDPRLTMAHEGQQIQLDQRVGEAIGHAGESLIDLPGRQFSTLSLVFPQHGADQVEGPTGRGPEPGGLIGMDQAQPHAVVAHGRSGGGGLLATEEAMKQPAHFVGAQEGSQLVRLDR